jgi:hypothetical protein
MKMQQNVAGEIMNTGSATAMYRNIWSVAKQWLPAIIPGFAVESRLIGPEAGKRSAFRITDFDWFR